MSDWQKELWSSFEKTASEMEKLFRDMGLEVESFADEVVENIQSFAEQVKEANEIVISEIDDFVEEVVSIITATQEEVEASFWEDIGDFVGDSDLFDVENQEATTEKNPACIGCNNYHGKVYNGNLLVCGIHPYGWDDENCPDWEEKEIDRDRFL